MRILDVGCGQAKRAGAIGMDLNPRAAADVLADVDARHWPFADASFDRIICHHIVEHVQDLVAFMEEAHRVGNAGALVEIVTPHFSNRYSYTDPTHRRHLGWRSFDYFTGESAEVHPTLWQRAWELRHPIPSFYTTARFRCVRRSLSFGRPYRLLGIQWLANRLPDFYELYVAFCFPARDLTLELEIDKSCERR